MIDDKFISDVPQSILNYLETLKKDYHYSYFPTKIGLTRIGENLNLGFSCYALKIYFMTGEWAKLESNYKQNWIDYINSFQKADTKFPENYYIDDQLINGYKNLGFKENSKYIIKATLNLIPTFSYDTKQNLIFKSLNAETKQAISTLYEVNSRNLKSIKFPFVNEMEINQYLNFLDWSKPWTSGAQFASLCVYNTTQNLSNKNTLINFIDQLADPETGSYFKKLPSKPREIINGAMKVISGLDWIDTEIHYPKKLIDFCLNNQPISEGCDLVDYVYVLYKTSKQTSYRKSEVVGVLKDILNEIIKLYVESEGGFQYFPNKSQTHYYGLKISNGENTADIHGTLLSLWAILMILDTLDIKNDNNYIIKP